MTVIIYKNTESQEPLRVYMGNIQCQVDMERKQIFITHDITQSVHSALETENFDSVFIDHVDQFIKVYKE